MPRESLVSHRCRVYEALANEFKYLTSVHMWMP